MTNTIFEAKIVDYENETFLFDAGEHRINN